MAKEYNFQYTPLTGRLPGNSFVKQTEQAINELAGIVNEGSAQVEVITNLANTANDNAEEALEKANEALSTASRVYITLPNLSDADDYYNSELYYFANSYSTNLPVQDTGFLEVKTNDTKTACEQVFIADLTGLCYFRHGTIASAEVGSETVYTVTWSTWSSELASEDYVQSELLNYLSLNGGSVTGNVDITGDLDIDGDSSVTGDLDVTGSITGDSVTSNSVNVKSGSVAPVNTLQRSTAYSVDDIVYTSALNAKYYLLCVTAGTTSATMPSFSGAGSNTEVTDGTVVWRVQTITSQEYVNSEVANAKNYTDSEIATGVPTGCVQAFAGNTTPQGWLLCDGSAVSRTQYSRLFGVIGTTYGSGDGTDTFNLPNLVDKFVEGSSTAGTEKTAGLPNIKGNFYGRPHATGSYYGALVGANGVFKFYSHGGNQQDGGTAETGNMSTVDKVEFDASTYNSIYGNSTTVQPPSVTMRYIIKY